MPDKIPEGSLIYNRYQIQGVVGQGGLGRIYLALDKTSFDERCAVKEFAPPEDYHPEQIKKARELFEGEAKILHDLAHDQIPKFRAFFEEAERLFLVQDFIEGKTYKDLQKEGHLLEEKEVMQLLADLLPVLDYVHEHNIIHRDISPANIIKPNRGEKPILIDFGVAGRLGGETIVGNPLYAAPEHRDFSDRGNCFPSSDLYALGLSIMVLLTGERPMKCRERSSRLELYQKYKLGDRLTKILDKMLAEDPIQRYQSAQKVIGDLGPEYYGRLQTTVVGGRLGTSKELIWKAIAIFLGVVVIGGLLVVVPPQLEERRINNIFNSSVKEAKTAIALALNKNIERALQDSETLMDLQKAYGEIGENWQKAEKRLENAIEQLSKIPQKRAEVYLKVQQVLPAYERDLEALSLLSDSLELCYNATNTMTAGKLSEEDRQEVRASFLQVGENLKQIPSDSPFRDRADKLGEICNKPPI